MNRIAQEGFLYWRELHPGQGKEAWDREWRAHQVEEPLATKFFGAVREYVDAAGETRGNTDPAMWVKDYVRAGVYSTTLAALFDYTDRPLDEPPRKVMRPLLLSSGSLLLMRERYLKRYDAQFHLLLEIKELVACASEWMRGRADTEANYGLAFVAALEELERKYERWDTRRDPPPLPLLQPSFTGALIRVIQQLGETDYDRPTLHMWQERVRTLQMKVRLIALQHQMPRNEVEGNEELAVRGHAQAVRAGRARVC